MIELIKEISVYPMVCEFFVNFIDLQKLYLLGICVVEVRKMLY